MVSRHIKIKQVYFRKVLYYVLFVAINNSLRVALKEVMPHLRKT